MKKIAVMFAAFICAGCSAPEPSETAAAFDPSAAAAIADYAGKYRLEYDDGPSGEVTFDAGGNVEGMFDGEAITATFTTPEPGKVCFDNVSTGDAPHCWTNAPARPDGSWVATLGDGATLLVTPLDRR